VIAAKKRIAGIHPGSPSMSPVFKYGKAILLIPVISYKSTKNPAANARDNGIKGWTPLFISIRPSCFLIFVNKIEITGHL